MADEIVVVNADVVLNNIVKEGSGFIRSVNRAIKESTNLVYEHMSSRIALQDEHTLKKLAEDGHPYSKKNFVQIHNPFWMVHQQSGNLFNARVKRVESLNESTEGSFIGVTLEAKGEIGVDSGRAPEAAHVIFGTDKMIARNFPLESLNEKAKDVQTIFNERLRLK